MKIGFNAVNAIRENFLSANARERRLRAVIGEGKPVWPEVLRDLQNGCLKPFYAQSPPGQFALPDPKKYSRSTARACRGCPRRCKLPTNAPNLSEC